MSEDCLTLNVFTPPAIARGGLPVMVFLFGGGFSTGSAAVEAQWLSERNVVVVTINYRVGALGFMVHPALDAALGRASGNLGLRDQQLGLRWVRDNIAAFGGDPTRVLLFGESAGALSTCLHLVARGSDGLADAFIMQSGACVAGTSSLRKREQVVSASTELASLLCPLQQGQALVDCLRARPAPDFTSPLVPGVTAAAYWPYVDGELFTSDARTLMEQGGLPEAPLIVGSNRHERRFFDDIVGASPVFDRASLRLTVHLTYGDDAEAILAHYAPASDDEAQAAWVRLWTDEYFRCPARMLARLAVAHGHAAYLYSFEAPPAVHSQDLDYVFAWPCCGVSSKYPAEAGYPLLASVVSAMQGYWTNLARDGEPDGEGLPTWPAYTVANDTHMTFGPSITVGSGLSQEDCDFWDGLYASAP